MTIEIVFIVSFREQRYAAGSIKSVRDLVRKIAYEKELRFDDPQQGNWVLNNILDMGEGKRLYISVFDEDEKKHISIERLRIR